MPGFDPLTIAMLAVLAVLVFFMFRNSRKRKAQQEDLRKQIVPGADVMTNFGLFGKLISIDEVAKTAELEVSPGNIVKVHSQTIAKVVDEAGVPADGEPRSVEEAMAIANREEAEREAAKNAAEPQFGERVDEAAAEVKKPARRTTKKSAE
ncbi:MAG: preprotein translocase subunit YajC [Micrococcales bacterium 70-64]|nr:preprotein translocase subunit YajC [Leifsonia sp.]ODU65056.1 MAG: preprotein translocase subunit YajC [Leifsonia sp. SCN 70-46]OJX86748.1 MAG: preprotein translocase subunit YajC [Micrococcales bacterium 70-64]